MRVYVQHACHCADWGIIRLAADLDSCKVLMF